MKRRDLLAALAITTSIAGALPAFAETTLHSQNVIASVKQQAVSYADLDLSRKAGATVLLNRVRLASTQVCGPEPSVDLDRSYRKCVTDTMTRAVQGINEPLVSSLYQDKFGIAVASARPVSPASGVTAATGAAVH